MMTDKWRRQHFDSIKDKSRNESYPSDLQNTQKKEYYESCCNWKILNDLKFLERN